MTQDDRSYEKILDEDLLQLGHIARIDRNDLFERKPKYSPLGEKIIAVALCQGAALHYVNGKNGIKDFDVWTFYARQHELKFPFRRYTEQDFGKPKFGQSPDRPEYIGRRVDLLGRSLDFDMRTNPVEALQMYLSQRKTKTATLLAQKAVVLIEPVDLLGTVIWPPKD